MSGKSSSGGLLAFLGQNKRYWLVPLLIIAVCVALLYFMGGGEDSPFVYTIF